MAQIKIQFSRFSAFYSPLISTMSAGFLQEEGLEPEWSVAPPPGIAIPALLDGSADVIQSALSNGLISLEKGETPPVVHFGQINEMDGFFLTAREPDLDFTWDKLAGQKVVVDHGGQPLAMFKYACHKMGLDYGSIDAIDAGDVDAMDAAFRNGTGTYIHQQGPAPQQLEHDGVGHVVASVGEAIGPNGFSSLASTREWLETDMAKAFMRAYKKSRTYVNNTPAEDIAKAETSYFPDIDIEVLTDTIRTYQGLGCWSPHSEITKAAFEVTQDVFLHCATITQRYNYADVCVKPPQG